MAAMLGLEMARHMNIKKLKLQIDNEACIQVIKNKEYEVGECHYIVARCSALFNFSDWEVTVNHCYRGGNKLVGRMANLGVVQEDRTEYFHTPPYEIASTLFEDIMGVITPLLVM